MITYVCVLFDGGQTVPPESRCFDPSWVDKLFAGVRRGMGDEPFRFACISDQDGFAQETIHTPEFTPFAIPEGWEEARGWARKALMWAPVAPGPRICLDLDCIVVGDLRELAALAEKVEMGVCHDPYDKMRLCIGVSSFSEKRAYELFTNWSTDHIYRGVPSEMQYLRDLEAQGTPMTYLDDLLPGQLLSFKGDILTGASTTNARLVYFHGIPKPHQLTPEYYASMPLQHRVPTETYQWLTHHWTT